MTEEINFKDVEEKPIFVNNDSANDKSYIKEYGAYPVPLLCDMIIINTEKGTFRHYTEGGSAKMFPGEIVIPLKDNSFPMILK